MRILIAKHAIVFSFIPIFLCNFLITSRLQTIWDSVMNVSLFLFFIIYDSWVFGYTYTGIAMA